MDTTYILYDTYTAIKPSCAACLIPKLPTNNIMTAMDLKLVCQQPHLLFCIKEYHYYT